MVGTSTRLGMRGQIHVRASSFSAKLFLDFGCVTSHGFLHSSSAPDFLFKVSRNIHFSPISNLFQRAGQQCKQAPVALRELGLDVSNCGLQRESLTLEALFLRSFAKLS